MAQAANQDLLRKAGVSEDDIVHSVKTAEKALEISHRYFFAFEGFDMKSQLYFQNDDFLVQDE